MNDPIIGVRTTTYSLRKKKFNLHLTLCTKINSRWATFFFNVKIRRKFKRIFLQFPEEESLSDSRKPNPLNFHTEKNIINTFTNVSELRK